MKNKQGKPCKAVRAGKLKVCPGTDVKQFIMTKVKNLNGTSDRVPSGYESWIHYWKIKTGQKLAGGCAARNCSDMTGTNLEGAHVKKTVEYNDDSWYIVPLCPSCNKRTDEFYVTATLVPVNP